MNYGTIYIGTINAVYFCRNNLHNAKVAPRHILINSLEKGVIMCHVGIIRRKRIF
jgi:hypothetical protein